MAEYVGFGVSKEETAFRVTDAPEKSPARGTVGDRSACAVMKRSATAAGDDIAEHA